MSDDIENPYPIRLLFRRRVVPALVLASVLFTGVSWFAISRLELHIYLETTERRAVTTIRLAEKLAPDAWTRLLRGDDPAALFASSEGGLLAEILNGLSADDHVSHLKIFNNRRMTLFSTDPKDIGVREENEVLKRILEQDKPEIETTTRDGKALYEIYIPLTDILAKENVAFEVYEPASIIDEIILESFAQSTTIPLLLILLMGLWLDRLTGGAQTDIDARVEMQGSLRRQLERFVSKSAGAAARMSPNGEVPSRRVGMTLFYSDVRDFSSLAEFHPPQATVDFLNALMTLQIDVVRRLGGDVDKMIGDALLARFEGGDREARAITAAQEIQQALVQAPMLRGIGVGIYDGEAILGAIGPKERQDFTVIGDSVNIAARLCALARDGEVVVDELALRRSGMAPEAFSDSEKNKVKGRAGIVITRRWRPTMGAVTPSLHPHRR